jgi:hypothetical protein
MARKKPPNDRVRPIHIAKGPIDGYFGDINQHLTCFGFIHSFKLTNVLFVSDTAVPRDVTPMSNHGVKQDSRSTAEVSAAMALLLLGQQSTSRTEIDCVQCGVIFSR